MKAGKKDADLVFAYEIYFQTRVQLKAHMRKIQNTELACQIKAEINVQRFENKSSSQSRKCLYFFFFL